MDSGKGIKEEHIDNIFSEYAQVGADENRNVEGVGLGLAITHKLVEYMGGTIEVSSGYGIGSTFAVTLPQKIISHNRLAHVDSPETKGTLLYERREVFANSIACTIDDLGVRCAIASSDGELRERITGNQYAFIFVSFPLFERNRYLIMKHAPDSKIVMLTEFGEAIPERNFSVLAMPVHALSIANLLNGVTDSFTYAESEDTIASFMAPNARVLVVDDINTNLKVAKGLLMPYRMHVDLSKSGIDAIQAVKENHYDLVFMDHRMPGMDGVEATMIIREMGAEEAYYKQLPIIALTANAVTGIKEMLIESGFDDFLSKPIDTIKLNTILEKWLPQNKQLKPTPRSIRDLHLQSGLSEDGIPGLDTEIGITRAGGMPEQYREVLAVFCEDGVEKLRKIRECLDAGKYALFGTHVHGLKSAAANVGAMEISDLAKALESAEKLGDTDFIEANSGKFIDSVETLLAQISAMLGANADAGGGVHGQDAHGAGHSNREAFIAEMKTLEAAIANMDSSGMNESIENMHRLAKSLDETAMIRKISSKILMADYDDAAALLRTFIDEG
jgi:CheY-like chemotaxis protein/HPt (histidine-containing phosphotransfer) domain-containing protein